MKRINLLLILIGIISFGGGLNNVLLAQDNDHVLVSVYYKLSQEMDEVAEELTNNNSLIKERSNGYINSFDFKRIGDSTYAYFHFGEVPKSLGSANLQASEDNLIEIRVPSGVEVIHSKFCAHSKSLKKIVLPETVTSIEDSAFEGCESLTDIVLPGSLKSIGNSAFKGCRSLEKVVIPNSVTSIGDSAFEGCERLTDVALPRLIKTIPNNAFRECRSIEKVIIPNSVTSIEERAFYKCDNLKTIVLPGTITRIENSAFWGCKELLWIRSNGVVYDNSLPNSLKSIGYGAFYGCRFSQLSLSNTSIITIGDLAFGDCKYLFSVGRVPSSLTTIGDSAFSQTAIKDFYYYDSVTSLGKFVFPYGTKIHVYRIGTNEEIGVYVYGRSR